MIIEISGRIARIEEEIKHMNANDIARTQNTFADSPDDPLWPLIHPTIGAPIPYMPRTSRDIYRMKGMKFFGLPVINAKY